LYKRIANAESKDELWDLQIEMIDRFGLLPGPVQNLFSITELKQRAALLGVKKIDVNEAGGRIVFNNEPRINAEQLILLIQKDAQRYRFDGADKLRFVQQFTETEEKLQFMSELLNKLGL
jgi:transcription-repair coupling factor (superfamily II helicase)